MSIPRVSETRDRCVGPLSGVEAPVVEGDDSYTAMIQSSWQTVWMIWEKW